MYEQNDEIKDIPDFPNYKITFNGDRVVHVKKLNRLNITIDIPIVNNFVVLKSKRENIEKLYYICDLIALAFLKIPLDSGIISFKDGNQENRQYSNLLWKRVDKNYNDIQTLIKYNIELVDLPRYKLHRITSDGHVINKATGHVMLECYKQKDGKGRVRLPLEKGIKGKRPKDETVIIQDLISEVFIKKPFNATILCRKNGLEMDNHKDNFEWSDADDMPLSFIRENRKIFEPYIPKEDSSTDSEDEVFPKNNMDLSENTSSEIELTEGSDNEDGAALSEDFDEDDAELSGEFDEDDDFNLKKYELNTPHEPIYEEFLEISEGSYDLSDCVKMEGKLWKRAKYKDRFLKGYMISENFELYSKKLRRKVTRLDSYMRYSAKRDEETYVFEFKNIWSAINLKDIVASTFLKVPKNPATAIYRHWNKDNCEGKYYGQKKHYTNIKWLTDDDFADVDEIDEKLKISKHGDLYSLKKNGYKMYKETVSQPEQLRRVKMNLKIRKIKGKVYQLHLVTALAFVRRPDDTYVYLIHKDGDISNNHYKNLVWVNTLSGVHNDGIRYFEIPRCPKYVLSETNIPYSFKRGILKKMKIYTDIKRYKRLCLVTDLGPKTLLFHRIVASTRNDDYDPALMVDHIDRDRGNCDHKNLHSVTAKQNSENVDIRIRGKEIYQMNLLGNILATFNNSKEASLHFYGKISKREINKCACKNSKDDKNNIASGGFIWKYVEKREKYVCKPGEYFRMLKGNFQGTELDYDNYMISNFGTLINVFTEFSKRFVYDGYPTCNLSKSNKQKIFSIHRLVGLVFVHGKTSEKNELNHKDENILNFNASNLEWVSRSENMKYSAYKRGTPVKKICMETNKVINVFNSYSEGARSCGKSGTKSWCITKACTKEYKYAFGYFWEDIKLEDIPNYPQLEINIRKN
jgi:hypothetical protein